MVVVSRIKTEACAPPEVDMVKYSLPSTTPSFFKSIVTLTVPIPVTEEKKMDLLMKCPVAGPDRTVVVSDCEIPPRKKFMVPDVPGVPLIL